MASDYGFKLWNGETQVETRSMPGLLTAPCLVCRPDTAWAATSDFDDLASNHCAATTITNYALWYLREYRGRKDATGAVTDYTRKVFSDVHRHIPNGPVLLLKNKAARYFRAASLPVSVLSIKEENIREELEAGNPVAIMVAASVMQWHWILVVGYLTGEDSLVTYLIEDNWHRKGMYTYTPGIGSKLLDVLAFHVEE